MFNFPWTNVHELNLDWIIDRVKHIPTKLSQLANDMGFVTAAGAASAAPVQSVNGMTGDVIVPGGGGGAVDSVNGQTGTVVLTAADVGAKPSSYAAPVDSVNGRTGAVVLTAADVGAKPSSYAAPVDSVNGLTGAVTLTIPDAADTNPLMDGTVDIGSSSKYAKADHRHPKDTSKANLASPTFTGTPKAPTAATGTNTTQLATTAFVQQEFSATGYQEIADTTTFTWGEVYYRFHKWGKLVLLSVRVATLNGSISADVDLLPFTRFPTGYTPDNVDTYDYTGFIGRGGGGTQGFGTLRLTTTALKYSPYTEATQGLNFQGSITYLTA